MRAANVHGYVWWPLLNYSAIPLHVDFETVYRALLRPHEASDDISETVKISAS